MIEYIVDSMDDATKNMLLDLIQQGMPFLLGTFGALFLLVSIFGWEWLYKQKRIRSITSLFYFRGKDLQNFIGLIGLLMLYITKLFFRGV